MAAGAGGTGGAAGAGAIDTIGGVIGGIGLILIIGPTGVGLGRERIMFFAVRSRRGGPAGFPTGGEDMVRVLRRPALGYEVAGQEGIKIKLCRQR